MLQLLSYCLFFGQLSVKCISRKRCRALERRANLDSLGLQMVALHSKEWHSCYVSAACCPFAAFLQEICLTV